MMNHSHVAVLSPHTLRKLAGSVVAPIVDHDDLIHLGEAGQRGKVTAYHALDVGFLVMRRQKNA